MHLTDKIAGKDVHQNKKDDLWYENQYFYDKLLEILRLLDELTIFNGQTSQKLPII